MTRFGDTDRAKLFYFVNNQFRPAQVSREGIYGGFHGGPEQSMLEKLLRERLGVFRLSRDVSPDQEQCLARNSATFAIRSA